MNCNLCNEERNQTTIYALDNSDRIIKESWA